MCQMQGGEGLAVGDRFFDGDQSGGLEAAGVGGEVSVGQASLVAELDEALARVGCECGEDAEAAGVGDEGIDAHLAGLSDL